MKLADKGDLGLVPEQPVRARVQSTKFVVHDVDRARGVSDEDLLARVHARAR